LNLQHELSIISSCSQHELLYLMINKQLLSQVIIDQAKEPLPKLMVPRWDYQDLTALTDNKQIIILTGIRRCGKSILMHLI